ncbi:MULTISPECIES: hypothetical protein [unclassified Amycolatopsis]|uniref:hypothetical protein n=1 Tax=unclassified Amycolatopsis TaxID=2618356 RepID=UPI001C6A5B55|nr:hypothetical protein [Amycolatopsis sp. DSM 110486]QYN25570.1 hypothetical protein K1T34_26005 [Amycolatopsis sp. DSM 110486]
MNRVQVLNFFRSGQLDNFKPGIMLAAVLDVVGDPDAVTGPLPAIYAFGDLQLGFSEGGILWYLAIEPSGGDIILPGPSGAPSRVDNFTLKELMDNARVSGEELSKCEPFVSGEYWWRISGARVFIDFDEAGLMNVAQCADQRFEN